MKLHENRQLFSDAINAASQPINEGGLGIKSIFIEKDYWICRSLQMMSKGDSENKHARVLNLSAQRKPRSLPLISQIIADETQKHNNCTNCLSLRNNAALLHSSLHDLRENIHARVLNLIYN